MNWVEPELRNAVLEGEDLALICYLYFIGLLLCRQERGNWSALVDLLWQFEFKLLEDFSLSQFGECNIVVDKVDDRSFILRIVNQELHISKVLTPSEGFGRYVESYFLQKAHHDYYKHKQITEMLSNKRKGGYSFVRKEKFKSQKTNLVLDSDSDKFDSLKKEVKRIEIMTRIENRQKTSLSAYQTKVRPSTSMNQVPKPIPPDFRRVGKEYMKQKSLTKTALLQPKIKNESETGLLGEWKRYQQFSKQELIQKLISLEHLANTIFKKNKFLEEEMKQLRIGKVEK